MDKFNAEYGILVTTSTFSKSAIEASRIGSKTVTLIDRNKIVELVAKYQLHVTPVTTFELNEFYDV